MAISMSMKLLADIFFELQEWKDISAGIVVGIDAVLAVS